MAKEVVDEERKTRPVHAGVQAGGGFGAGCGGQSEWTDGTAEALFKVLAQGGVPGV